MNCHGGGPADVNAKAGGTIAARRSAARDSSVGIDPT
jgi:hypothetical protein